MAQALQLPYLFTTPTAAPLVRAGGGAPAVGAGQVRGTQPGAVAREAAERTIFAYRIPYLPDLLLSPHLAAASERDRLEEALNRQAQLVANLAKWKGMAFALRYLSRPDEGRVDLVLAARGLARAGYGSRLGEEMARDLASVLSALEYPVEPVVDPSELEAMLQPVPEPWVVEIRQREEVLSLLHGDAYVVYPFRPPTTTWIAPMEMLLRQQSPCVINVHLEPTKLLDYEAQLFAQASSLAETLSDWTFEGLAYRGRLADPQARLVARLYTDYLERLADPLLVVIQVASPDPFAARNVAQALGAEVAQGGRPLGQLGSGDSLPTGFDLVEPTSAADLAAARHVLSALDLVHWGPGRATPGKERLAYLADSRTASAAFRFPVALRGGVPGVRTRQPLPAYEVGPRAAAVPGDQIPVGTFADRGGVAAVPLGTFVRHALVAGTTGSGKTTTCMHLLAEFQERAIPSLVIEPAKREYRSLLDSPLGRELRIFTLGEEDVSPFRLNPIEILPGVRVETHISYLRACLEAALPSFGILPSLIEESLHNVYLDKGWALTDRGDSQQGHLMPTLGELYFEIVRVTEERGYSSKTGQDIRAAAAGRIGSLLRGSKGRMLNTRRSMPLDLLMASPTVLEMNALNNEEKALVMLFLLTALREHCETTRPGSSLHHVTLIEEAHRIMGATPHAADREVSGDTRAEAVSMFSEALSELRALGEGIIVAEQIPVRLAQDALKNTSIKIVHCLPGEDDRRTVGGTMNLGPEQEPYLAKLPPGQAALFVAGQQGYERPTFVTVPNYRRQHGLPERVSDERIKAHMASFQDRQKAFLLPFQGCAWCLRQCHYRDRVGPAAYDLDSGRRFRTALWSFEQRRREGNETVGWLELAKTCQEALAPVGLGGDEHAAYCYFSHSWAYNSTSETAERFRQALRGTDHG